MWLAFGVFIPLWHFVYTFGVFFSVVHIFRIAQLDYSYGISRFLCLHSKSVHNEFGVLFSIIIRIIGQTCCIMLCMICSSHVQVVPQTHVPSLSPKPMQIKTKSFYRTSAKIFKLKLHPTSSKRIFNLCVIDHLVPSTSTKKKQIRFNFAISTQNSKFLRKIPCHWRDSANVQ